MRKSVSDSTQHKLQNSKSGQSQRPVVLTVSANDSSGLAGMSMDIKVQSALGVHCAGVLTANTAQSNSEVLAINPLTDLAFQQQLQANSALNYSIVKAGLLVTPQQIDSLIALKQNGKTLVVDPVFKSTSDHEFTSSELLAHFKYNLLSQVDVLTPNLEEAQKITGIMMLSLDDIPLIANKLLTMGVGAVYLKGGHYDGVSESQSDQAIEWCQDYFTDGEQSFWLSSRKLDTNNTRGTGCALASAIASALALGYGLYDAAVIAKMTINQGLANSYSLLEQKGSLAVYQFPQSQSELPLLTENPQDVKNRHAFPQCDAVPLGLYPVVDSADWLAKLLPLGVTTVQLRVKNLRGESLEQEIRKAISIAEQYHCRLFINDYWQLAIDLGAYGVHLGQEDLETADIDAILQAGLRLGISTHCHFEVARAHTYRPSYIACGPVYATTTKDMPWVPHGPDGLAYWVSTLEYPVVAIGGIHGERVTEVKKSGCSGVAMITAITHALSPESTTTALLAELA